MAGLAELYENPFINTAIGFTPVLGDVQSGYETANSLRKGNYGEAALNAIGLLPYVPSLGKLAAAKGMAGMMMPFAGAIKASHGSPHQFDAFDFSKIGTGEGAQAFGHGGYFAQGFDSPVARTYANDLASAKTRFIRGGNELDDVDASTQIADYLKANKKVDSFLADSIGDELISGLQTGDDIGHFEQFVKQSDWDAPVKDAYLEGIKQARLLDIKKADPHLYNVSLEWPDAAREAVDPLGEHHLLDWDAPISQQSKQISEAIQLNPILQKRAEQMFSSMSKGLSPIGVERMQAATGGVSGILGKTSGREAYQAIMNELEGSPDLASKYLRDLGVPGIKYLDGNSRSAGNGSRNYVIFSDQIPKIVSRNGQPVGLAGMLEEGR